MTLLDEAPLPSGPGSGIDPFVQMAFVHDAIDDWQRSDFEQLDDEWFAQVVLSAETLKTRVESMAARVAAESERRSASLKADGFFSSSTYLKHHGRLSGPKARIRMQIVRMFDLLPDWKEVAERGNANLGVDQVRLMAKVAANPRIHDVLVEMSDELLFDALWEPFDVFEQRLRDLARLADPDGAASRAEKNHDARDVTMTQKKDGSWRLWGRFGSLQGAEINEILAWFNQAEFDTDWAGARNRLGVDQPAFTDLDRREPQRRADALHQALLRAAGSPADGAGPIPCLNVLIDDHTFATAFTGGTFDPGRFRTMTCRTQNGEYIDVSEAASLALFDHIRRVVHTSAKVVTDLGRKSRVFRGNSREAALLMTDRCVWPGCDRKVRRCQADHNVEWQHTGATDGDNACCLCGKHNRLKTTGRFRTRRLADGSWLITHPDGRPVGGQPDPYG